MTAIAVAPAGKRIATTVRIHVANPWTLIIAPWLILMGVFVLNLAIWQIVLIAADGRQLDANAFRTNGGVSWVVFYMAVVAIQAMNQTFSFVVGLGATRRDYFLGTAATFVALSVFYGVGIALLSEVEHLTNGWGVNGAFFAPIPFDALPLWEFALVYALAMAFMMFVGSAIGAMFVRWGASGIMTFFAVLALLLVGSLFVIAKTNAWAQFGHFFTNHSVMQLALFSLPVTVVAGFAGYAIMRRATPKG